MSSIDDGLLAGLDGLDGDGLLDVAAAAVARLAATPEPALT